MFSILIVDDNYYDREGVRDLVDWNALDIEVTGLAADGREGLAKARELKPDFILTDIAMPLMDGIEMTREIKKHLPTTRFIFMSCFDEFAYARAALELNVSSYVMKPVELKELTDALEKMKAIAIEETRREAKLNEMREIVQKSLPILRTEMIRDLVYNKVTVSSKSIEAMTYLGLHRNGLFRVILLLFGSFHAKMAERTIEEEYLLIHQAKTYVESTLLKINKGYLLILDTSGLCVVLADTDGDERTTLDEMIDACSLCRDLINQSLGTQVAIAISDPSNCIFDVPKLFASAEQAASTQYMSRGNQIILASEVAAGRHAAVCSFDSLNSEISVILDEGTKKDILPLVERYMVLDQNHGEVYVKSFSLSVMNALQIILSDRNESMTSICGGGAQPWNELAELHSLTDMKKWIVNILSVVKDYLDSQQDRRYRTIVSDIKRVIGEEYATIQNVGDIVRSLFISSSYANRIFKHYVGMSLFEYLVKVRMEKARNMLEDPYRKIYEISESVGYVSKSYFSSLFKETTGMSPKQYRDRCGK